MSRPGEVPDELDQALNLANGVAGGGNARPGRPDASVPSAVRDADDAFAAPWVPRLPPRPGPPASAETAAASGATAPGAAPG